MNADDASKAFLPFAQPTIGEEEIAAVVEVMRSGWLTTARRTAEFESAFAAAVGAEHALAVNSCTAALHLALDCVGVGAGDRVAVPIWTFTSAAEVVRYERADPLFVDCDPATLNLDPAALDAALDRAARDGGGPVRAVVPVHIAGEPCAMDEIAGIARRRGLRIVEDAAHAFPAKTWMSDGDGRRAARMVGTIADVTAFSFYATKTITTGEGGMATTADPDLAKRMKVMRLHGFNRDAWDRYTSTRPSWYYEIVDAGYKYNLTDIASAMGLVQLRRAGEFLAARAAIAGAYDAAFADLTGVETPRVSPSTALHSWHLYVLRLDLDRLTIDRDAFIAEMTRRGIGCSVHFIPLHFQPYWRDRYGLTPAMFPVASREFARVVSLPIYPRMTAADTARVIDAVRAIVRAHRR